MTASVVVKARSGSKSARIEGTRVHFSVHQCFRFDDSPEERALVERLCSVLTSKNGMAVMAHGPLLGYMLRHAPRLKAHIRAVIPFQGTTPAEAEGLSQISADAIPDGIDCVFLCETLSLERMQMRRQLPSNLQVLDPSLLAEVAREIVPQRGWTPIDRNIYPLEIPDVKLPEGMDLLLLDCPARNLALMPNGLAYVNNALKMADVSFAVFDLDIITYHRYHMRRLFDDGGRVVLPNGRVLPVDPWQAEHYDFWAMPEVINYFMPIIVEAANEIVRATPKVLGLSVQQCSEAFSSKLVSLVREQLPELVVVVGGFSCYNADIGLKAFPQADYMCVGEADLTIGPLIEALARGERPRNLAGIVSQHDDPKIPFIPAPMPHNLSALEAPKYEWFDLNLYRNFNGYQLTPVIASRGCRWSRCTFCAERFYWRIRDPKEFVDELEWLAGQGCTLFMFNESDLNGMPEKVLEICDEIIRRGVNVKLTGQLRIHKKSDRAYFQKLRKAGFVALRFGVDAFSANTLRLQKKGYTPDMVSQNLRDCWEAGIFTEVNWVIGVPGETDADVDEGIELILKNRHYIGRLANINPLILVNGGVYWLDPESHNIVFREPKEVLYAKNPKVIPADLWYSTAPYIDAQVRKERFEKIVLALHDAGFPVGEWAARVIEDVKYARDRNRAGGAKSSAGQAAGGTKSGKPVREETLVVGGEVPRLVRQLGTHNVVFYKGLYYALPLGLGPIDLTTEDVAGRPGVVIDPDEEAVLAEIELVGKWADSRGHFDAQEKQRAEGSYFKAGSALGEQPAAEAVHAPILLSFDGQDYAIAREELDNAFSDTAIGGAALADREPLSGPARPRSLWHHAFNLLPGVMRAEIRKTAIAVRISPTASSGGELAMAVLRSLIRRTRTQGLTSLFGKNTALAGAGETIPGTDIVVFGVTSKDATPDLLRTIENYNLVQFDSRFYGVPHGVHLDWNDFEVQAIPGLVVASTAKEATYLIEEQVGGLKPRAIGEAAKRGTGPASEFFPEPILLESIGEYNVVGYEGWVYGIPTALGRLDLTEVDVTEMPGVIKDVARDVVVNEINFLSEQRNAVAAA